MNTENRCIASKFYVPTKGMEDFLDPLRASDPIIDFNQSTAFTYHFSMKFLKNLAGFINFNFVTKLDTREAVKIRPYSRIWLIHTNKWGGGLSNF